MDPSRTLIAFLLETDPSVTTVQLIGSWDNFASCYSMDRDARRGRGHWRGCHSLKEVVCDGSASRYKTHTGLAMGHTYYYYYEINGSTEVCDPAAPFTTSCPCLPGQKVNTLYIPEERTSRQRCASLSSLSDENIRTMDPRSKFVTPQPAPASHADLSMRRTGTAAPSISTFTSFFKDHPNSPNSPNSLNSPSSPTKIWRRFFPKTLISHPAESRGRSTATGNHRSLASVSSKGEDIRPQTPTDETLARDISPDSLPQFLSLDMGSSIRPVQRASVDPSTNARTPPLEVLDQVEEEDNDEDCVGIASSALTFDSEEPAFTTRLSPPPFKRAVSPAAATSSSGQTVMPSPKEPKPIPRADENVANALFISTLPGQPPVQLPVRQSPIVSALDTYSHSTCPSSTLSSTRNSPASVMWTEFPAFYDNSNDDKGADDLFPYAVHDDETRSPNVATHGSGLVKVPSPASFSRYCLPQLAYVANKPPPAAVTLSSSPRFSTVHSPLLLARPDEAAVGSNGGARLIRSSIDLGLDDFANELSWLADSITSRH